MCVGRVGGRRETERREQGRDSDEEERVKMRFKTVPKRKRKEYYNYSRKITWTFQDDIYLCI